MDIIRHNSEDEIVEKMERIMTKEEE